jgi:hypothetical protein
MSKVEAAGIEPAALENTSRANGTSKRRAYFETNFLASVDAGDVRRQLIMGLVAAKTGEYL